MKWQLFDVTCRIIKEDVLTYFIYTCTTNIHNNESNMYTTSIQMGLRRKSFDSPHRRLLTLLQTEQTQIRQLL